MRERSKILAAGLGRVIYLIDDRSATGFNDYWLANMIFVDHGDSKFSTYVHHRPNSAQVRLGDLVTVGSSLAEVGRIGTVVPHLHFDLRGGNWETTHDVRFMCDDEAGSEVLQGRLYKSKTSKLPSCETEKFQDSKIVGTEFLANGIKLDSGIPAYRLPIDTEICFQGEVVRNVKRVHFYLWQMGKKHSELTARAHVNRQGRFCLRVRIPRVCAGSRWYRITCRDEVGKMAYQSTLPACVY